MQSAGDATMELLSCDAMGRISGAARRRLKKSLKECQFDNGYQFLSGGVVLFFFCPWHDRSINDKHAWEADSPGLSLVL